MQLQSFMYSKNVKSSTKSNPNEDALQSQSSLAEYSRFVWGADCRAEFMLLIAEKKLLSRLFS